MSLNYCLKERSPDKQQAWPRASTTNLNWSYSLIDILYKFDISIFNALFFLLKKKTTMSDKPKFLCAMPHTMVTHSSKTQPEMIMITYRI